MKSFIKEFNEARKTEFNSSKDLIKLFIQNRNKCKKYNCGLHINLNTLKEFKKCESIGNLLSGVPFCLKDLFCTKGIVTTAGTKCLNGFIPTYNSFVYEQLLKNGAVLMEKSNCDELGTGGTGLESAYGPVINPFDKKRIVGGSSSGSVVEVCQNVCLFAIATDSADSTRAPCSYMGLVGYKPSYGLISRYGLIPFCPSLDTVGIITRTVCDAAIVAEALFVKDDNDITNINKNIKPYTDIKTLKDIKINIIKDIEEYLLPEVKDIYLSNIEKIKTKFNVNYVELEKNILECIGCTYEGIMTPEFSSCLNNFVGQNFGDSNGDIDEFRDKLGTKPKEKIILGKYLSLEKNIYENSRKMRTLINEKFNKMIGEGCLIIPSHSFFAPTLKDIQEKNIDWKKWLVNNLLCLANLNGSPSITIPTYKNGADNFGLNINTKIFEDQKLINIALTLEELFE